MKRRFALLLLMLAFLTFGPIACAKKYNYDAGMTSQTTHQAQNQQLPIGKK